MKTNFILTILFCTLVVTSFAQDKAGDLKDTRIPLIGETAPSFTAESTQGTINFPSGYFGKWKILFSHPADFTAVCSSEILELAALQDEFDKLNTVLVVLSVDGVNSHLAWQKELEQINYKERGSKKINFPLVSDHSLDISRKYGMIHSYSSTTRDVRGVFIIDDNDRIRSILFYPMNVGRNLDEIKRTLVALQTADKKNVLLPANWTPGQDYLLPSPKTTEESSRLEEKKDPELYELVWFMWFKKAK